jgi:hypothetical protein
VSDSLIAKIEIAIRAGPWFDSIAQLAGETPRDNDDTKLLKEIADRIREHLDRQHTGKALRWSVAGFAFARSKLHLIADALRPSVAPGRASRITRLLEESKRFIASAAALSWHLPEIDSWLNFARFYLATDPVRSRFESDLAKTPDRAAQMALALCEERFMRDPPSRPAPLRPVNGFEDLDLEQACTGASHIVEAVARMGRLHTGSRDRRLSFSKCKELVFVGYQLHALLEQEILVFRMGYRCSRRGTATYRVEPPNDSVGVALSSGYLQEETLPYRWVKRTAQVRVAIEETVQKFSEAISGVLSPYVLVREGERPHFRYQIREGYPQLVAPILNRPVPYQEEEAEVRILASALRLPPDDLLLIEVIGGLPVVDVLRVQRLLRFLALARESELKRSAATDDEKLAARPMVVARQALLDIAAAHGVATADVETFLRAYAWDPASGDRLDIQYTPIVSVADIVILPLAVASYSNLPRNGFWKHRVRPYSDGAVDPVAHDVEAAFKSAGARVWPRFRYTSQGKQRDIDVLVLLGSVLVAFEAKNTMRPCSTFEERTTWDHLEKAAEQLNAFRAATDDVAFRKDLSRRLGVDVASLKIKTCIVLGHPLLGGAEGFGHPVRSCNTLGNFVANGAGRAWIGSKWIAMPYRNPGPLQPDDLLTYLSDRDPTTRAERASAFKTEQALRVGNVTLEIAVYAFNFMATLARSGLLSGEAQTRLDRALARVEELRSHIDTPTEVLLNAVTEAHSAHDAALDELERVANASDEG